jgi:gluconolactonase
MILRPNLATVMIIPSYPMLAFVASSSLFLAATAQYLSPLPQGFSKVSAVLLNNNLAILPEWNVTELSIMITNLCPELCSQSLDAPFYDITSYDSTLTAALNQTKAADFIAFEPSFLDFIGPNAMVERVMSFPGVSHVHEAPVYIPESNELLFADTSAIGWLYLYNVSSGTVSQSAVEIITDFSPLT